MTEVPGYETPTRSLRDHLNQPSFVDSEDRDHRVDGPALFVDPYEDNTTIRSLGDHAAVAAWRVYGREASMTEVYGRFVEALSDRILPSTDPTVVRDLVDAGAIEIDEALTIRIENQTAFDAYVERFSKTWVRADDDQERPVNLRVLDEDSRVEEVWVKGDWQRSRRFGKAVVDPDNLVTPWYLDGVEMGYTRYLATLLRRSDKEPLNWRAAAHVAGSLALESGGLLVEHSDRSPRVSLESMYDDILNEFPVEDDRDTPVRVPDIATPGGEIKGFQWFRGEDVHRADGPAWVAPYSTPDDPVHEYGLDGETVSESEFLAQFINARSGREPVHPDNSDAIAVISSMASIRPGDESNDYATRFDDVNLSRAVDVALAMHANP